MSIYHGGDKVLSGVTSVNEETMKEIANELFKYEDITSSCVIRTDSLGSNGNLPKVYKNCNSIVIDWNVSTVDAVDTAANYGHIKIPKNSNYTYIIGETFATTSRYGTPTGLVRVYINASLDDYIYITVTGQMIIGTITTGTDTIRGLTEFKFIEN